MLISLQDKLNLLKRGSIGAVNDILMSACNIDHSRHRSPLNVLVHILSWTIKKPDSTLLGSLLNSQVQV